MEKEFYARCMILRHIEELAQSTENDPEINSQYSAILSALSPVWGIDLENLPPWIHGNIYDLIPDEITKEEKINSLLTEGNKEFGNGNFDQAYKIFTEALEIDPESEILYSRRAETSIKNSQFNEAIEDLLHCLEINPNNPGTYAKIGFCKWSMGNINDARNVFIDGLSKASDDMRLQQCLYFIGPEPHKQMPDILSLIENKKDSPELQELMKDDEISSIVSNIEQDPDVAMNYSQNPAFLKLMTALIDN